MEDAGSPPVVDTGVEAKLEKTAGQLAVEKMVMQAEGEGDELVEVQLAQKEANAVFNRVKSEKIAEQALSSIRNDHAAYEGLAKEIVGKALKQRERERANRASAAASRAKVIRYQTELETRLNRVEAERNQLRAQMALVHDSDTILLSREMTKMGEELQRLRTWFLQLSEEKPALVKSLAGTDEITAYMKNKETATGKRRRIG